MTLYIWPIKFTSITTFNLYNSPVSVVTALWGIIIPFLKMGEMRLKTAQMICPGSQNWYMAEMEKRPGSFIYMFRTSHMATFFTCEWEVNSKFKGWLELLMGIPFIPCNIITYLFLKNHNIRLKVSNQPSLQTYDLTSQQALWEDGDSPVSAQGLVLDTAQDSAFREPRTG